VRHALALRPESPLLHPDTLLIEGFDSNQIHVYQLALELIV
jgi:hypothetical protein